MARRPSTAIASPSSSPSGIHPPPKLSSRLSPLQGFRTPTSPWPPRSTSFSVPPRHPHVPNVEDPDELFAKLTILEVKQVHQRLLTDADAKQEELRLMVGERYRDLLQASSSIISIAQSSRDVISALEDVNASIPADIPQSARRPHNSEKDGEHGLTLSRALRLRNGGDQDSQLRILQSVAAHMKLLLDTPEHIWRLLEKKKYLHAGWLFLLARIIYQALMRDDTEDEDDWIAHGIVVPEQFPLVQRQWDTVAQLRAQITYKATLSLRDSNASLQDISSILLTLHLLESRPLVDVLAIFLTQRARGLQTTLSRSPKSKPNGSNSLNGSAPPKSKKAIIREVREGLEDVLEVIASTVGLARDVFREGQEDPSLMSRMLSFIQSDVPIPDTSLPSELQMSTQHLLSTLPSASHFVLLPGTIRSYKPYVDLTSAMSAVSPAQLGLRIGEWFSKAVAELKSVAEGWFTELRTLKEVWAVRSWFNDWLRPKELEDGEKQELVDVIDGVAHGQAVKILRSALGDLQDGFQDELQNALVQLRDGTNEAVLESTPAKFLFQPLAPPPFDVGVGSTLISAFRKYESTVRRQVTSRTPLLHKIVSSLENGAKALQEDSEGKLSEKLREAYAPLAEGCCKAIISSISLNVDELNSGTDANVRSLAFLTRLTEALHVSSFHSYLKCETAIGIDFHGGVSALRDRAINQWQGFVIATVLADYQMHARSHGDSSNQPSWSLMQALLSLSSYVHSIDAPSSFHARSPNRSIAEMTLRRFTASLVDALASGREAWGKERCGRQASFFDMKFLRRLLTLWTPDWDGLSDLDELIKQLEVSTKMRLDNEGSVIEQHVLRTQILLAPLLPPVPQKSLTHPNKSSTKDTRTESLLLFGIPAVEQTAQPVMDLVKPGPRFGSLLVGSTTVAR